MKLLVRNRVFQWLMIALLLFWVIAPFFPRDMLLEYFNGLALAISVGILTAWLPGIWDDFRKHQEGSAGQLVSLGIATMFVGVILILAWGYMFVVLHRPPWMIDHIFRTFISYIVICSFALFLLGGNADERSLAPSRTWRAAGIVVASSLLITVTVLFLLGLH